MRAGLVTRCRRGAPSQSSSAARSWLVDQTAACAVPVVGRRTPGGETSLPRKALNSDDLPLPVAPASATTVASPSAVRAPALASTRARGGGRRGRQVAVRGLDRVAQPAQPVGEPDLRERPGRAPQGVTVLPPGDGERGERDPQARGAVGGRHGGGHEAVEALLLGREQPGGPLDEVLAGRGGEPADRGVAEHRLEDLLADRAGAAGDRHLGAGQARRSARTPPPSRRAPRR